METDGISISNTLARNVSQHGRSIITGGCLEPATLYMRVVNQDNLQDTLINFRIFVMTIIGLCWWFTQRTGTTLLKSIHATTGEALPYEFHHATEQEVNRGL